MSPSLRKFIISPPFGTYISHPKATSVLGTFTRDPRPGKWKQVIKTLRYTEQGWVNKIGLRNPGWDSIKEWNPEKIYSFGMLTNKEFYDLYDVVPDNIIMELNQSCPNVQFVEDVINFDYITRLTTRPSPVIIKFSPIMHLRQIQYFAEAGVKYFHISNTLPVPEGGLSGRVLQHYSLPLIEKVKKKWPGITVIGGGGIYNEEDLRRYEDAGADHFSLATAWFKPWRAWKLINQR